MRFANDREPETESDVAVTAFSVAVADAPVCVILPAVVSESAVKALRVAVVPVLWEIFPVEDSELTVVPSRVVEPPV